MARPAKYSVEKQLKYIDMFILQNNGVIGKQPYADLERFTASQGDKIPADTFRRTPEVSAYIQKLKKGDIAPQQESAAVYKAYATSR